MVIVDEMDPSRATSLDEAVLLAGVEDGAADLVAAAGHVDDGQGDIGGGWAESIGRQQEGVRDRRRVHRGQVHQVRHG